MKPVSKSRTPKIAKDEEINKGSLNLYLHHLEQLDKLFKVIDLLKKENKQLRQIINKNFTVNNVPERDPAGHAKPKITCWKLQKEE